MQKNFKNLLRNAHIGLLASILVLGMTAGVATAAQGSEQKIAASVLNNIGQASWVSEGKGPHTAYIFFDPNCPFCHKLFEETRGVVKAGKLRLRWIPVGILTPTSHGKAVAILGARNPLKAFYRNEDKYTRGNGGVDEDLGTPEVENKLKANEGLLDLTQMGAVPLVLFHSKNGTPVLIQGAPPKAELLAMLAHVK